MFFESVLQVGEVQVGDIVEVERVTQKGRVEFVGEVHFRPGKWVGVLFATPMGKNNGVIEGRKYFCGVFRKTECWRRRQCVD